MEENKVINEAIAELQGADETKLKEVIEKWFEKTRNEALKIGARFISAAVAGVIQKHLKKGKEPSKRDFERCIKDIENIIMVQLTEQNDSNAENENDGTTSENN